MAVQSLAGYWNLDLGSHELLLCPRSRRMFGIDGSSPKKLGRQAWLPRIHPDDLAFIKGQIETAARRNEIYAARFRAVRPDGSLCQILGVGRLAGGDRRCFVGLNFDLAAAAETADLEFGRPGATMPRYRRSPIGRPKPASEKGTGRRPAGLFLEEKSLAVGERAKDEAAGQMLIERALAPTRMRQLREELLSAVMVGEPPLEMVLALYLTEVTSVILIENRKAHAARIDKVHEELGQRLTAISLAVGAIEADGERANAVALIRTAVEEARQELKSHRRRARQDVLT